MNEEIIHEVVRQLERLGGPAWEYALRQAYVVGWLNAFYTVLLLAITLAGVLTTWHFYKKHRAAKEESSGRLSYEDDWMMGAVGASAAFSFIFGTWAIWVSFVAARILLNPHYEAMKQLSNIIRGG